MYPLQTKVTLISWLNLSIIYWHLSKNKVLEQINMFQIKSCDSAADLDDLSKNRLSSQILITKDHSHFKRD